MKTRLSVLFSLVAICGQLHADPVSSSYDYRYGKFLENSKELHQEAISVFEKIIPHEEQEKWAIVEEHRSWGQFTLEWSFMPEDYLKQTWVSISYLRCFGTCLQTYFPCNNYIDDDGFSHTFTIINDNQAIEEIVGMDDDMKYIVFLSMNSESFPFSEHYAFSRNILIVKYMTYQNILPEELLRWEPLRDLWIRRLLNLETPQENFNGEDDDSDDPLIPLAFDPNERNVFNQFQHIT